MKKFDPSDVKPCSHMQGLVSADVDGKLHGVAKWYTDLHVKGCSQCQASIPFLISLKERLSDLDADTTATQLDEHRQGIQEQLDTVDADHTAT